MQRPDSRGPIAIHRSRGTTESGLANCIKIEILRALHSIGPAVNESVRPLLHFPCDDSTLPGGEAARRAE